MSAPMMPFTLMMTSREISTLTGKEHKNVKADIAKMLLELEEDALTFQRIYLDTMNREQIEFLLDRELTETLLTGYSAVLRRKVIARWRELEEQQSPVDPMQLLNDPIAMRGLLLGYTEKVLSLEATIATQAPKVQALNRIATVSDGSFCIRDAAKNLQIQEKKLKKLLVERKWVYQRPMGTGLLAYADRLQQGLMEHKLTQGEKSDGSEWSSTQARITAKGMAKLSELIVAGPIYGDLLSGPS